MSAHFCNFPGAAFRRDSADWIQTAHVVAGADQIVIRGADGQAERRRSARFTGNASGHPCVHGGRRQETLIELRRGTHGGAC
jgi:hypothetical protein